MQRESENRKIPHEREVNTHESQVCGEFYDLRGRRLMSFKIIAESDLWESRGTFTLDVVLFRKMSTFFEIIIFSKFRKIRKKLNLAIFNTSIEILFHSQSTYSHIIAQ
jgi:hypothetical protein